jgi:uncharacterized coiled-coil DUF342 family protein
VTRTNDELRREVVTLLQQSAELKMEAQRLLRTADELRRQAEGLKDAIEQSKAE